jgi:hypothetical protein
LALEAMVYGPLTISRRHVLGDLYSRCERLGQVPVYLNDALGERLGFVDESKGHYADAFTFHISEENCKKLAGGQFLYSFNYDFATRTDSSLPDTKRRIKLNCILLTMRKGYDKPQPRSARRVEAEQEKRSELDG